MASQKLEISVYSDGYEGRILEWTGSSWFVFEHHNFRHSFNPANFENRDYKALREHFALQNYPVADEILITMPPDDLHALSKRPLHVAASST